MRHDECLGMYTTLDTTLMNRSTISPKYTYRCIWWTMNVSHVLSLSTMGVIMT